LENSGNLKYTQGILVFQFQMLFFRGAICNTRHTTSRHVSLRGYTGTYVNRWILVDKEGAEMTAKVIRYIGF